MDAAGGEPELTRQDRWANADYLPQNPLVSSTELPGVKSKYLPSELCAIGPVFESCLPTGLGF